MLDALKRESEDLKDLLADTLVLTSNGTQNKHLFARLVVFAEDETVTKKAKLIVTEPEDEIDGTFHTTVCKPDLSRPHPVTLLLRVLP